MQQRERNHFKKIVLSAFIYCVASSGVTAQSIKEWPARISMDQGLSQSSVTAFAQDTDGFIWMGTDDGLNRYDAYSVLTYKKEPGNPLSLSNNEITALCLDSTGTLWVGTMSGLCRYDRDKDYFHRYLFKDEDSHSLSSDEICSIYRDSRGRLWIGTMDGLDLYRPESDDFTRYYPIPCDSSSREYSRIFAIMENDSDRFWLGTNGNGAVLFNPEDGSITHYLPDTNDKTSLSGYNIFSITKDKQGRIWLATWWNGLDLYEPEKNCFRHFDLNVTGDSEDININTTAYDGAGGLLVATYNHGLFQFDPGKEIFSRFSRPGMDLKLFDKLEIISIFRDRAGTIWLGSSSEGSFRIPLNADPLRLLRHDEYDKNSLSSSNIFSLAEDRSGAVWIGTNKGGLNRLDTKTEKIIRYLHRQGWEESLIDNNVWSLLVDRKGTVWIGTDKGLDRYNKATKDFIHIGYYSDKDGTSYPGIISLLEMDDNTIWLGTQWGGIQVYDKRSGQIMPQPEPAPPAGIFGDGTVSCMLQDSRNNIWAGTDDGLVCCSPGRGWRRYRKEDGLPDNSVITLMEGSDSTIWIGTAEGLGRLDPTSDRIIIFNRKHGLPSSTIYGLVYDKEGDIWISTGKGLSRLDPVSGQLRNYSKSEGLQNDEFNANAVLKCHDGTLYFGGVQGLNIFEPRQMEQSSSDAPLCFTNLSLFNQHVAPGDTIAGRLVLDRPLDQTDTLRLNWRDRMVGIEYASLDYVYPQRVKYRYRLKGLDSSWNLAKDRRFALYTNLPPGTYTFICQASYRIDSWPEQGRSLIMIISPPFWMTTFFRLLLAGLALALVYLFYQKKTHAMKRRTEDLEKYLLERTQEISMQKEKLSLANKRLKDEVFHRQETGTALRRSEQLYRTFIQKSPYGIYRVDFDTPVPVDLTPEEQVDLFYEHGFLADCNEALARMYGYSTREEIIGTRLVQLYGGKENLDNRKANLEFIRHKYTINGIGTIEVDKEGHQTSFINNAVGVIENGKLVSIWGTQQDVTTQKEQEESSKKTIDRVVKDLQGIRHRIKSDLALIANSLIIQESQIKDKETVELFRISRSRLLNLIHIHENLNRNPDAQGIDLAHYLVETADTLLHLFGINPASVHYDFHADGIILSQDKAIPISMIINELLVGTFTTTDFNSGKKVCKVSIQVTSQKSGRLKLVYGEEGLKKASRENESASLGTQLIHTLVESHLGGTLSISDKKNTQWIIQFPLKNA